MPAIHRGLLPALVLLIACSAREEADPATPQVALWDNLTPPQACGLPLGDLFDAALADAGIDASDARWRTEQWEAGSYSAYLNDPFRLHWFYEVHHTPLTWPCVAADVATRLDEAADSLHPATSLLSVAMERVGAAPNEELPPTHAIVASPYLADLPTDLALALTPIIEAMETLSAVHETVFDAAPAKLKELVPNGHGGVLVDVTSSLDMTDPVVRDWLTGDETTRPSALFEPTRRLAYAIENADLSDFTGQNVTAELDTPLGDVIIAGSGDDATTAKLGEVALYLDLGGDDIYLHPAGASSKSVPVAVHIDLDGDDIYTYEETDEGDAFLLPADEGGRYGGDTNVGPISLSTTGRHGSGQAGVGLLFDYGGGDDHYQSLRMSQGWGHLGVGVLLDDGGHDAYLAEYGAQGGASNGIGVQIDLGEGHDERRLFGYGQGFGYVGSAGISWDGGGDDIWFADPGRVADGGFPMVPSAQLPGDSNSSFAQGAGFGLRHDAAGVFLSGGLGAARDRGGDDVWTASVFAQGTGYWQGTGMLLDGDGSDTYDALWYVQGGAAHYAAGVLLDDGIGNDAYGTNMAPVNVHQGSGHDFSAGILVDEGGDDTYALAGLAGGASNCQGFGFFVDNDGVDTYTATSTRAIGYGNQSSECASPPRTEAFSIGLFLDSGGDDDTYSWPDDGGPSNDAAFGHRAFDGPDEFGGGIDGDGETGVHAGFQASPTNASGTGRRSGPDTR